MQRSKQRLPRSERESAEPSSHAPGKGEASSPPLDAGGKNVRNRGEGQARRVPSPPTRVSSSGDDPLHGEYVPASEIVPASSEVLPSLSDYKGMPLKDIGRDDKGRVIQHKYSTKVARQIAGWIAGGYDANAICVRLNMRPGVLKKLYMKEVQIGVELIGMEMTSHILARAKKSDRMAIFFAKAKMGWRDGESRPLDTGGLLNIHIHT